MSLCWAFPMVFPNMFTHVRSSHPSIWQLCAIANPSWWDWAKVIPPWSFVFWTHISAVQSLQAGATAATDLLRQRWCKSALPNLLVVQHPNYKNHQKSLTSPFNWNASDHVMHHSLYMLRSTENLHDMSWYHLFQRYFSAHDILLQWFWRCCSGDQSWR